MPIDVRCACGERFEADNEDAGMTAECPACGAPLVVSSDVPPHMRGFSDVPRDLLAEPPRRFPIAHVGQAVRLLILLGLVGAGVWWAVGAGTRVVASPTEAFVGHWRDPVWKMDVYVSRTSWSWFSKSGAAIASWTYTASGEDAARRELSIKVPVAASGAPAGVTVIFGKGWKSLKWEGVRGAGDIRQMMPREIARSSELRYVDSRTEPKR